MRSSERGAPVVVVPPNARPPEQLAGILTPLEATSESSQALDDTIMLAHRCGLEILVLHVHSPATVPGFSDHDPNAARAWEREFLSRYISTRTTASRWCADSASPPTTWPQSLAIPARI